MWVILKVKQLSGLLLDKTWLAKEGSGEGGRAEIQGSTAWEWEWRKAVDTCGSKISVIYSLFSNLTLSWIRDCCISRSWARLGFHKMSCFLLALLPLWASSTRERSWVCFLISCLTFVWRAWTMCQGGREASEKVVSRGEELGIQWSLEDELEEWTVEEGWGGADQSHECPGLLSELSFT